ncbi:hypothetical protein [Vogesella oryzae]|uniref:hypothetical protein n=1 Tax=Vogesella oryzae TaxID=1735285 RepID=UPI001582490C|nr:hypothetical protein [Vogesella oryzae]
MTFEEMKAGVQAGHHIKNNSEFYAPPNEKDRVSAFIDLIKYHASSSARRALNNQFLENFDSLSTEEKATLAELDNLHLISAILIDELQRTSSKEWIGSSITILSEMANAIAIVNGNIDLIDSSDNSSLYRFFVHSKIESQHLPSFSNDTFFQYALTRLLNEERVIFTWIVNNLILLVEQGHLDPSRHTDFFLGLFKKSNYIQGELSALFATAVSKTPNLFEALARSPLSIDPFTRQVNFSLWLQDSAKFKYIATLRNTEGIVETGYTQQFDQKFSLFREMNKFDRGAL